MCAVINSLISSLPQMCVCVCVCARWRSKINSTHRLCLRFHTLLPFPRLCSCPPGAAVSGVLLLLRPVAPSSTSAARQRSFNDVRSAIKGDERGRRAFGLLAINCCPYRPDLIFVTSCCVVASVIRGRCTRLCS